MVDALRYSRSEDLLRLALMMASHRQGLSLNDIQEEFEVGRRTAERYRDAILRIFPDTVERRDYDRFKRWHIPRQRINDLVSVSADDLAALHSAEKLALSNNMQEVADRLNILSEKLKTRIDGKTLRRIEPDLEALIEAEGFAIRQGPKPKIDEANLEELHFAIKAGNEVTLTYMARGTRKTSKQHVQPYGFLYGSRHYLVAYSPEQEDFRLYSLPNIQKVEVGEAVFERQEDFELDEYASRSFGVFQEDPIDVVWKVSAEAAEDAREYMFHPTQKIEEQKDGSLIIRFNAGGMLEMCWELFKWGGSIEVLEPPSLVDKFDELIEEYRD
ncbi:MAG: WYL domain-containing protein [Sedimenticola sp.]